MKKLVLAGAVALFGMVSAQEVAIKPVAGDVTVDLGVSGGLGNTSINLPDQGFGAGPMFKARYFKTDKLAYRGTVVIANTSTKEDPSGKLETKENNFGLGLGFGVERHFTGTQRLSPYYGGDVMIGFGSTKATKTDSSVSPVSVTEKKGSDFKFGVRGVFGADYYFVPRVFLGVEAGLGLMFNNEGDTTISQTGQKDITINGGSNFKIEPAVVTGIRLGYAF